MTSNDDVQRLRERLILGLTQQWEAALDARLALCATSPARVLNDLLRARAVAHQ
jgi:hypothetical protein